MKFALRFLVSIFLFTAVLQPGMVLAISSMSYRDVAIQYKHSQAIQSLSASGIVRGYADGTFRPDETINRAEAIKILVEANFSRDAIDRALDSHRGKNHWYVNVPDVLLTDWFGPYVEIAFVNDIARGYPDNTFRPGDPINFAEGLKVILEAYGADLNETSFRASKLLYAQPTDWFAPYFAYAQTRDLINVNKFYHPAQPMTRGEFAEIMYRLNVIKDRGLTAYNSPGAVVSDEYTITIPRLNIISQKVGFSDPYNADAGLEVLRHYPFGHYLAKPDSGQKFVLYGHSSGYAWDSSPYKVVLRQINQMEEGDMIYINYQEKGYAYRMYKSEIIPEHMDAVIMENAQDNEMVIYTCWPPDSTASRYVVHARPL